MSSFEVTISLQFYNLMHTLRFLSLLKFLSHLILNCLFKLKCAPWFSDLKLRPFQQPPWVSLTSLHLTGASPLPEVTPRASSRAAQGAGLVPVWKATRH